MKVEVLENIVVINNKLIAKFMELKSKPLAKGLHQLQYEHSFTTHGSKEWISEDMLLFHSSWDWLIPVICKITSMNAYIKYKDYFSTQFSDGGIYINTKFIDNTYNDVVEFIKWYNKENIKE